MVWMHDPTATQKLVLRDRLMAPSFTELINPRSSKILLVRSSSAARTTTANRFWPTTLMTYEKCKQRDSTRPRTYRSSLTVPDNLHLISFGYSYSLDVSSRAPRTWTITFTMDYQLSTEPPLNIFRYDQRNYNLSKKPHNSSP